MKPRPTTVVLTLLAASTALAEPAASAKPRAPELGLSAAIGGTSGLVPGGETRAEAEDPRTEALFAAVRKGDAAEVARLLDGGVDVDAKGRYATTALFFAADKGRLAVVDLLLARGADVAARDTFYGGTPLTWAVERGHVEIVHRLLEKGSPNPETALELAVKAGDERLVSAVLARGPLSAADRALWIGRAREANASGIVALLEGAATKAEPEVAVPAEALKRLAGDYAGDRETRLRVELKEGRLEARTAAGETWPLVPLGEDRFRAGNRADGWVQFGGRGGTIEWADVQEGARQAMFRRAAAGPGPSLSSPPPGPAGGLESPGRSPAAPWPSFRGKDASGIADGQGAPTAWDLAKGENVLWKTAIPGLSNSSPIVWGDRIYLVTTVSSQGEPSFRTGLYGDVDPVGDEGLQSWRLLCVDRTSGRLLFERVVHEGLPRAKRHTKSSYANPTPATDGRYVVAQLGSEGLYAFDMDGRVRWKKDLGALDSGWFFDPTYQWGFASSPILYGDSVIAQVDVQKGSFIAAWDLATGRELWRTPREEISTWGTPTIVRGAATDELVTNGTTVRAYDPRTGLLLWSIGPNSEVTVATPVAADGIVYVTAGYPPVQPVYAVRAGARGKLDLPAGQTSSASVAWSAGAGGTYIPTPVVYRGHLYTLHNNGRLQCYDARTGELLYRVRVGGGGTFTASPVAADGRLFLATEEGDVHVVRAGPSYELIATSSVGEPVVATPAVSGGVLVVRTLKHLLGLGETAPAAPAGRGAFPPTGTTPRPGGRGPRTP